MDDPGQREFRVRRLRRFGRAYCGIGGHGDVKSSFDGAASGGVERGVGDRSGDDEPLETPHGTEIGEIGVGEHRQSEVRFGEHVVRFGDDLTSQTSPGPSSTRSLPGAASPSRSRCASTTNTAVVAAGNDSWPASNLVCDFIATVLMARRTGPV